LRWQRVRGPRWKSQPPAGRGERTPIIGCRGLRRKKALSHRDGRREIRPDLHDLSANPCRLYVRSGHGLPCQPAGGSAGAPQRKLPPSLPCRVGSRGQQDIAGSFAWARNWRRF
jgi:hypothetical protein